MTVFKGDYKNFQIIKVSERSILNRKPILGVGVNDAGYMVEPVIGSTQVSCPIYNLWYNMLKRCFCKIEKDRHPTYLDVSVCDEWLSFSSFRGWVLSNDWQGLQLDKDIIKPLNKVYSPEFCCFVSQSLNKLLTSRAAKRGKYKLGVSYHKGSNKLVSQIVINGKKVYIGSFSLNDEDGAHRAYAEKKCEVIESEARKQADKRVFNGLMMHSKLLRDTSLG